MTLWDWAVRAYAAEGVEIACLDLQDAQAQNAPLLLWAAWTAATGRSLEGEVIEAAVDTARAWDENAVGPLRGVRRRLKNRIPDLDDGDREVIRHAVKTVELEAERRLLGALERLVGQPEGPPLPLLPALVSVSRVWGEVTPRTALALLAQRLPG